MITGQSSQYMNVNLPSIFSKYNICSAMYFVSNIIFTTDEDVLFQAKILIIEDKIMLMLVD